MEHVLKAIFPQFAKYDFTHQDLAGLIMERFRDEPRKINNPREVRHFLNRLNNGMEAGGTPGQVSYAYGGWMEDRRQMFPGTRVEQKPYHLGVDITLNADIKVHSPVDCIVAATQAHKYDSVGWGTRLILKPVRNNGLFLFFGNLSPELNVGLDNIIPAGAPIGKIGRHSDNGGVFSHLHIQSVTIDEVMRIGDESLHFDCYAENDSESTRRSYPEPLAEIAKLMRKQ